jgi:branched-chain amino acid aminotransferase
MQIARDEGVEIVEREIARAELYTADEVFVTGTAAEVTPIREVDDHEIGEPGPVTKLLQQGFDAAIHGRDPRYLDWLDVVTSDVAGEGAAAR